MEGTHHAAAPQASSFSRLREPMILQANDKAEPFHEPGLRRWSCPQRWHGSFLRVSRPLLSCRVGGACSGRGPQEGFPVCLLWLPPQPVLLPLCHSRGALRDQTSKVRSHLWFRPRPSGLPAKSAQEFQVPPQAWLVLPSEGILHSSPASQVPGPVRTGKPKTHRSAIRFYSRRTHPGSGPTSQSLQEAREKTVSGSIPRVTLPTARAL